jgi:hypothetical protein
VFLSAPIPPDLEGQRMTSRLATAGNWTIQIGAQDCNSFIVTISVAVGFINPNKQGTADAVAAAIRLDQSSLQRITQLMHATKEDDDLSALANSTNLAEAPAAT